ncbi:MAG TPA: hypothetical protein VGB07_27335 [Blastocatellia bacterium]
MRVSKTRSESWQTRALVIGLTLIVTLLPIANITWIVATTGADTVSNDYITYVEFFDRILNGTYNWRRYFDDTFIAGAHSMALPTLVRLGVVKFADWNIYLELYVCIALAILKLVFLHQAFTHLVPRASHRLFGGLSRWLMWPVLAALGFSLSQINVFTFGDAGLQIMFVQFGCALGVWGLVRFRQQWRGIGVMATGGVIATLSGGGGLLAWPVFLIGLVLLGFRKVTHYAVWFAAAAVASLPYVFYMVLWPKVPRRTPTLFNREFIISAIGWPFTNDIASNLITTPRAVWAGYAGLAFGVLGLALLWGKRNTPVFRQAVPGLMYLVFGLLGIWQTSLFRANIAPWYTTAFLSFWIGLVGLAYVFWVNRPALPAGKNTPRWLAPPLATLWVIALSGVLFYLYATSNFTYADKAMYLHSRSPVSASCLRNYKVAPTSCEQYLFQWGVGNPGLLAQMAKPLERHHLSVFAPHQQWTLQGDYALDNVRLQETPGIPDVFWSADRTSMPAHFAGYNHLNLFLHSPNAITWRVSLPASVEQADFYSAVTLSRWSASTDGVSFEVYLTVEGEPEKLVFQRTLSPSQQTWQPFSIPLSAYAGRTIELRLTSSGGENGGKNVDGDWAMYRYPYIDVTLDSSGPSANDAPGKPFVIKPAADDAQFGVADASLWRASNMQLIQTAPGSAQTWKVNQNASLEYIPDLNFCLADYTHFYVRLAVSPGADPRSLQIFYKVNHQSAAREVKIPLLADGEMHEYTFDLKSLFLNKQEHLTGLRLAPLFDAALIGEIRVEIADFRLIRRDPPKFCATARP